MVLQSEMILNRLKELDTVINEMAKYRHRTAQEISEELSLRWIIERALIAVSNIVFDITDHILSSNYSHYAETYEESLAALKDRKVISGELYSRIKGLGGFRNVLVHGYLGVDIEELHRNFIKSFDALPNFSLEIQEWLSKNAE